MSRIRTIKPGFFTDETLNDLEEQFPELRPMIIFSGLFCLADANGVFKWSPRPMMLAILPYIKYDILKTLDLLEKNGFIASFDHAEIKYGIILKFRIHQAIQPNEYKYINEIQEYTIPPHIIEMIHYKVRSMINISPYNNEKPADNPAEIPPNGEAFELIPPVSKIENFRNKMLGEIWIEGACVNNSLDKEKFTKHVISWVENKIINEAIIYSIGQMREYCIADFKKIKKDDTNGKPVIKKRNTAYVAP